MTAPSLRSRLTFGILLVTTGILVLLSARSFAAKVRDFQPLGFTTAPRGLGFVVIDPTHAQTGLRAGDVLLLVNGQQPRSYDELARALRQRPRSEVVVQRGAELVELGFVRPPLRIDWSYLLLAVGAIIYLLTGIYTLTRGLTAQSLLFHLWCLCSAAVYLLSPSPPFHVLGQTQYLVEELARLLLPPLTLHFFLIFPRAARTRVVPFLYLPALALFALQLDLALFDGRTIAGRPTPRLLGLLDRVELLALALFAVASIAVLALKLRRTGNRESRRQLWWITIGMAGGYTPFLLLYLVPRLLGFEAPDLVRVLAVVPLLLVPLSFAYAILRYRLWDMAIIVRDLVTYSLTMLLGIFGFTLLNLLIDRGVPEGLVFARQLLNVLSALLIGTMMLPTSRSIGGALQRFHYGDRFRTRRALARLGFDLLHERDLARLAGGLLNEARTGLELERIDLYLASEAALVPYGDGETLDGRGVPDEVWAAPFTHLAAAGLPAGDDRSTLDHLLRAGYRYAFPLTVQDRRVGLVVTGYKAGQVPLSSDDAVLLRQLFNQAALALENAQLVEQLRRQLTQVTALQQWSAGIIESAPAGMAVIDHEGRVVSANAALASVIGQSAARIAGGRLAELLSLERLPAPGATALDCVFRRPDGAERLLQIHVAPLDDGAVGEGDADRAAARRNVAVVHDVTERVLLERRLREQERLAALGVMAASVAHEVNTPLTGISSYAQMLLRETPADDRRHAVLRKIERQTFRAARIVNGLLQLARHRQVASEPIDLAAIADECSELLADRLAARSVGVFWRQRPAQPLFAWGNESELHQVVTNLMLNSIEATADRDSGRIELALVDDGDRVRFELHDDGPGIAVDDLARIFEPLYTTKSGRGGTGLGLAISREIVLRRSGELSAHNRSEGGAAFVIVLPRWAPGAPPPETAAGSGALA